LTEAPVAFGEVAFEVARDAYEEYRRDHTEADLRTDLERLAQASQAEVRQAAEGIAAQEAVGQPAEVWPALVSYLSQFPASIRQSLRRPSDPGGTTIPAGLALPKPEDLLPFLPAGLPQFKPGDRPLAADWELVELLGKGGFGEVWKARHLTRSRQRPVALKFCLDPVAAATLRNEAILHDHLDRVREEASAPGIVPLLETYLRADPPCLMYEFIEGGDLAGLTHEMQAQDRLTPELAIRIVQRLASIVGFAHRLNPPLVHRDLKLSNILVRRGNGDLPDLFIADFGIGGLAAGQALREQSGNRIVSNQLLPTAFRGAFTPLYASPQQVRGERPDPRDDVHALGVIWYQLVTGDTRLLSIPPDWQEVVEERGLGKELIQMLASCLSSKAEKRPTSAASLAEKLAGHRTFDVKQTKLYKLAFEKALRMRLEELGRLRPETPQVAELCKRQEDERRRAEQECKKREETGEKCPQCGRPLVRNYSKKTGREFIGCSGFKEGCKYIKPAEGEPEREAPVETDYPCPTCGKPMLQRMGRTGPFLGCSGYPDCKTTMNFDTEGKPVLSERPTEHVCEKCGKPMVIREGRRGPFLACTGYPECRNAMDVDA
jgi:serine/threonine protein kinase